MNTTIAENRKLIVCKSSAGSGKTFTLVKHYLRIALSDSNPKPFLFKKILAITFTNKAAAEMKERILKTLHELSESNGNNFGETTISTGSETMKNILIQELQLSEETIRDRSKKVLNEILHSYADFSVSTIDSFVHRIIRTFAFDLGLPINFAIETDEKEIINQAVDTIVSKVGQDPVITELLKDYTLNKIDDNKNWQVDQEIKSFLNGILNEVNRGKLKSLEKLSINDFKNTRLKITERRKVFSVKLEEIADRAFELLKSQQLEIKDLYLGASGIMGFFTKIKKKNFNDKKLTHNPPQLNSNIQKTLDRKLAWTTETKDKSKIDRVLTIQTQIQDLYFRAIEILENELQEYNFLTAIEKEIFALSLLNEVEKEVKQIKADKNILFLSEFNQKISKLILEEPVPFIFERMGEKYHYFLLDEFQDTSVNQWLNLLPLLHNSVSENHENLIVGDAKQSIYRWRGGETSQFSELPKLNSIPEFEFKKEWEKKIIENYQLEILDTNYRSYSEIIQFNNIFFGFLAKKTAQENSLSIYDKHEQKFISSKLGGWVTIDQLPYKKDETIPQAFLKVIEYIEENITIGYSYKDICIIVRKNETGQQCAALLTSKGIPVISSESLWLNNSSECNFVIQFLQLIVNPEDEIACAAIIHFLSVNKIFKNESYSEYLSGIKNARNNLIKFLGGIFNKENCEINFTELKTMPVLDACTFIVKEFNLEEKNSLYIPFFLDACFEFSIKNGNSIIDFIEWWNQKGYKKSVISPSGSNAVKILSIHASKGLEFPVVILPGMDWKLKNEDHLLIETKNSFLEEELPISLVKNSSVLNHSELQKVLEKDLNLQELDNLNLLYVAFTRAIHHLHIITTERGNYDKSIKDWIDDFVESSTLERNEKGTISIGIPFAKQKDTENTSTVIEHKFNFRYWNDALDIKQGKSKPNSKDLSKKDFGEIIHSVMAFVSQTGKEKEAIEKAIHYGIISKIDEDFYSKHIETIIYHPGIQPYYTNGLLSYNEKTLLSKDGQQFRVDRMVFLEKEIVLIDFKTGRVKNEDIVQMENYRNLLLEIENKPVKNILFYLEENILHEF